MIGGLIMVHGDDNGLRLPPTAPIQAHIMTSRTAPCQPSPLPSCVTSLGCKYPTGLDDRVDNTVRLARGRRRAQVPDSHEVGLRGLKLPVTPRRTRTDR